MEDLHRLCGDLADRLALLAPGEDDFRFDASSVPSLPRSLSTDGLVINRGRHDYNGYWQVDVLHLYASRKTLARLGVLVLASLFATPGNVTDIAMTHPDSDIRTLRLSTPREFTGASVMRAPPLWCDYCPSEPAKFPWYTEHPDPVELPAVYLTDASELGWDEPSGTTSAEKDTVVGFGSQDGIARFGQLLLNVAHPAHEGVEYCLEGEAGFRGVAPQSAELQLWLPGSFDWHSEYGLS
ncbi:hypothetical protein [Mycobacterium camsae]|uniref:hypothetical protein n=1 Tax=Mycobacterium gordonae TaxID=1778 RepID=UPI00197EF6D4|nr:hypothetical protein [Mycobacterium gordonae]